MSHRFVSRKRLLAACGGVSLVLTSFHGFGAALDRARAIDHAKITEVINDVTVLDPDTHSSSRATPGAVFKTPNVMKTGPESRSEMLADDQTITRVGANSLFSFEPKERRINLREGSVLFETPPGKGGGSIHTAAATASVLGTTIIVVATRKGGFKLLVLEGTGQAQLRGGQVFTVQAGQVLSVCPSCPGQQPASDFLLGEEVKTSPLIFGFKRKLPTLEKIKAAIAKQNRKFAKEYP